MKSVDKCDITTEAYLLDYDESVMTCMGIGIMYHDEHHEFETGDFVYVRGLGHLYVVTNRLTMQYAGEITDYIHLVCVRCNFTVKLRTKEAEQK